MFEPSRNQLQMYWLIYKNANIFTAINQSKKKIMLSNISFIDQCTPWIQGITLCLQTQAITLRKVIY